MRATALEWAGQIAGRVSRDPFRLLCEAAGLQFFPADAAAAALCALLKPKSKTSPLRYR